MGKYSYVATFVMIAHAPVISGWARLLFDASYRPLPR
jgi:hypothetical protein